MTLITDIQIIQRGKNDSKAPPDGYVRLPQDMREGAGGDYFYLCYRKDPLLQDEPVTDILVSGEESIPGHHKDECCFNSGKNYHVFFRKEILGVTGIGGGIEEITFVSGKSRELPVPAGFKKVDVDLNNKQGGRFIYLCYREAEKRSDVPLLWEWMKYIDGNKSIADLSMPSTHDSAMWRANMNATTYASYDSARTQYLNLQQQFLAGVRLFDLRIHWNCDKGCIGLCHVKCVPLGFAAAISPIIPIISGEYQGAYSHMTLQDAFREMAAFLHAHPTECVFLWMSVEEDIKDHIYTDNHMVEKYTKEVKDILKEYRFMIYMDEGRPINRGLLLPTLNQVRGKMVLISDAVGKEKLVSGNVHLAGGYKNDPWRLRYETMLGGPSGFVDLGDTGNNQQVMNGENFFCGGTNKAKDGAMLAGHIVKANDAANRTKMIRFSSSVEYEPGGTNAHRAAVEINPKLIQHLMKYPVNPSAGTVNRVGVGSMDFVGMDESLRLGFEVVKQNPEIAKMFPHGLQVNGAYRIVSVNPDFCLQVDGDNILRLRRRADISEQKFEISYNGDRTHTITSCKITSCKTGLVADVLYQRTEDGAQVAMEPYNGGDNQKWLILPYGDGKFFSIISKQSMKNLDINTGKMIDGQKIQIFTENFSQAQLFAFREV